MTIAARASLKEKPRTGDEKGRLNLGVVFSGKTQHPILAR
jgi:hypothetical protein